VGRGADTCLRGFRRALRGVGYQITAARPPWPTRLEPAEIDLCEEMAAYTMTTPEALVTLVLWGRADLDEDKIALLRLDTDGYASTRHELVHRYPRLASNGVLILDDYGCWQGARQATDEYFREHAPPPLLVRLDETVCA
jgi:hypothetical protein